MSPKKRTTKARATKARATKSRATKTRATKTRAKKASVKKAGVKKTGATKAAAKASTKPRSASAGTPQGKPRARSQSDLRARLDVLARDLWWTWVPDAIALFESIDPLLFEATKQSPLATLKRVDPARFAALESDADFERRLSAIERAQADYYKAKTWYARESKPNQKRKRIAYFCSEFAIHESLQQYSGGLGVLAGDHLKSASDLGVPLCGVGLLYQHGYYIQEFEQDGSTRVLYPRYDFEELPIEDTGIDVVVPVGARKVKVRVWKQQVGRVPIYLLDANRKGNKPEDCQLTEGLYKGEPELRLRQQVLLGVGGVRALEAVGEKITVFHLNEGHAAFANVERLRALVEGGKTYETALAEVRRTSVFTTHTPVPAGHDRYPAELAQEHMRQVVRPLKLGAQGLADLGREEPGNREEPLCMTVLALNTSERANGVSKLHGEVSREMWVGAFPDADGPDGVPIGHVTNGIHTRTWLSPDAYSLYERYLKPGWDGAGPEDDFWKAAGKIPDAQLWGLRNRLRSRLVHFVRTRLARQAVRHGGDADEVARCRELFDEQALTICFARRFATYKRAPLIFRDPDRLAAILADSRRPVQLVFAGKAHPRDEGGQAYAREIHEFSREERFAGRVALVEEYDMQVGRALTSGADVWLNNPIRPHEASGTSGMKPPLHGGINCSILDGWWPEGFDGSNGWAIGDGQERPTQEEQDAADAEALYQLLEKSLVPEFYKRGKDGVPVAWVARARASLKTIPARFSTHRMVADYVRDAYWPAMGR